MQTRSLALATLLGAFGAGLTGCELIAAVDHDLINQGGGGATTGGGGSGAGDTGGGGTDPGGGGSGAGPECMDPEDCGAKAECKLNTCEDGTCGEEDAADETECDLEATDDGVCSGGECVECIDETQCEANEVCSENGVCQPEHCENEMFDAGTETDVDCGDECEPCANALDCVDAADCLSGFCNDMECAPCGSSDDCAADDSQWCDTADTGGTCKNDLGPGVQCVGDDQCAGACADVGASSVCCSEACDGACESCLMIHTGMADGTCANVDPALPASDDPKDMCADGECTTGDCVAGGVCGNEDDTVECGVPTCSGDNLLEQPSCGDNTGTCATGAAFDCGAYSCDASGTPDQCFTSCENQNECSDEENGYYCVLGAAEGTMNTCLPKKDPGVACVEDFECRSLLGCSDITNECAAL